MQPEALGRGIWQVVGPLLADGAARWAGGRTLKPRGRRGRHKGQREGRRVLVGSCSHLAGAEELRVLKALGDEVMS